MLQGRCRFNFTNDEWQWLFPLPGFWLCLGHLYHMLTNINDVLGGLYETGGDEINIGPGGHPVRDIVLILVRQRRQMLRRIGQW